ncbi:hypothetical protein [Vibrio parahaemolyticus]|uniref:hypothetical protein n=1 Tax=Vibrio parahaemolyticus TaxID=670 RepID=UPI0006A6557A
MFIAIDPSTYGLFGGVGMFLVEALVCYKALKFEFKCMIYVWYSSCMVLIATIFTAAESYSRAEESSGNWMLDILNRGLDILVFGAIEQLGWILLLYSVLTWCMIGYQIYMESEHGYSYREYH